MSFLSKIVRKTKKALPFLGAEKPFVSILELHGAIGDSGAPGPRGLAHSRVISAIEAAFKPEHLSAVALAINSPGGSPVQSRLIHDAIRRLADEKSIPVYAFVEDVGASGGYILALAGDEIYADDSSIIGSIGVISASFGFQDAIEKLGVERRVYVAGRSKSQLDPFKPENETDVSRLRVILEDLHAQFITLVERRRGDRLKANEDTFTGAFWTAGPAKEQGLIDGIAHLNAFLQEKFGKDVKLKRIPLAKGTLLRRLLGGEEKTPALAIDPDAVISTLETRALWSRFGL